jgi:hypothetical protein
MRLHTEMTTDPRNFGGGVKPIHGRAQLVGTPGRYGIYSNVIQTSSVQQVVETCVSAERIAVESPAKVFRWRMDAFTKAYATLGRRGGIRYQDRSEEE